MATQYRKKPVVIEAMHLSADTTEDPSTGAQVCDLSLAGIVGWASAHGVRLSVIGMRRPFGLSIPTLEGRMEASPGDYIIRGVQGEFYPCKPDIFEATYSPAERAPEAYAGRITSLHFSDGHPKTCGMCDDCCQCCDGDQPDPEGVYLTVRLDDSAARVHSGTVTVTYDPPKAG